MILWAWFKSSKLKVHAINPWTDMTYCVLENMKPRIELLLTRGKVPPGGRLPCQLCDIRRAEQVMDPKRYRVAHRRFHKFPTGERDEDRLELEAGPDDPQAHQQRQ